ncbi:MAG: hypothetical protein QME28_05125 [Candidatus Saccharicenans sp.]|nr:hypothetical protein [Candidatus Saccharicenans sp.]
MKVIEAIKPGEKKARARALLLLSGGLDSVLAGKLLEEEGVEIVGLTFRSPFFGAREALRVAREQGWPLIVVDITEEQIQIVENPRYGYGRNLNPCIDCHGQMAKIAGELLSRYQADFVATGEVLGERPKSQNRQALGLVEKLSGIRGKLLRPLSARLLPETEPEKQGLIDREKLLDISGRSRKRQMELAEKYGLREYPTPAGGCLLTDPGFSARARQLREWRGRLIPEDIEIIKCGRLFFVEEALIVIGRDEKENGKIIQRSLESDILVTTYGFKGPLAAVRFRRPDGMKEAAGTEERKPGESAPEEPGIEKQVSSLKAPFEGDEAIKKRMVSRKESGEFAELWRELQEGKLTPEKQLSAKDEEAMFGIPAVKEACLRVIRYSRMRENQRAAAAVIFGLKGGVREFRKEDWQKYF